MSGRRQALVTGGTRGIGYGVACALARAGYRVTATGVGSDEVAACDRPEGVTAARLDVTDDEAVRACVAGLDRLDALVNCAGIILRGGAEFELEGFRRVIEVNLVGTMRLCVAARPLLAAGDGGCIVNTASMLSFFGGPAVPAYTASKGGVAQLTKALAAAWAADGIRVNAVAPGWIATELTRPLHEDEAHGASILARTPLGRWGAPEDVGGAVVFLCSEQAAFITGTILPVDGGYLAV
jgi:NAD(P)-dependent dehydrogenase (short-subunit alcohol dehydrogenase family)